MRQFGKLIIIGTIAGIALALFLKVIQILIGNQA